MLSVGRSRMLAVTIPLGLSAAVLIGAWSVQPAPARRVADPTPDAGLVRYCPWALVRDVAVDHRPGLVRGVFTALRPAQALLSTDSGLWIGTAGGLLFRRRDGQWTTYTSYHGLGATDVRALAEFQGQLWIGTYGGALSVLRRGRLATFQLPGVPESTLISCLHATERALWIGTWGGGLYEFDGRAWLRHGAPGDALPQTVTAVTHYQGTTWAGSYEHGLWQHLTDGWHQVSVPQLPDGATINSLAVMQGRLWVATDVGLWRGESGQWQCYTQEHGLPDPNVMRVVPAPGGDTVACTYGGGLARLDGRHWETVAAPCYFIHDCVYDMDGAWLATRDGLYRSSGGPWRRAGPNAGLPAGQIMSLAVHQRHLWIGLFRQGVVEYDGRRFTDRSGSHGPLNPWVNQLRQIDGRLYAATHRGLVEWNKQQWRPVEPVGKGGLCAALVGTSVLSVAGDREHLWAASIDSVRRGFPVGGISDIRPDGWQRYFLRHGLIDFHVYSMTVDKGVLWAGTQGGLSRFDGRTWTSYSASGGQLPHNWVSALVHDGQRLWAGTYGGGVAMYDGHAWHHHGRAQGLPSRMIQPGSGCVEHGRVWFGTVDAGAVVYDGARWHAVGPQHGLPSQTVTSIAAWGDAIWLGTWGGLASIDREQFETWLSH